MTISGPSVYTETVGDAEDAAHRRRLRSRAAQEGLDETGATLRRHR
ncbi:hypothetical protein [Nocardia mikamii]|nr:hypothetical protein [Nocardia mikamii]